MRRVAWALARCALKMLVLSTSKSTSLQNTLKVRRGHRSSRPAHPVQSRRCSVFRNKLGAVNVSGALT